MKKITWINNARAIAMFAIVLGHTLRDGAMQSYVLSFHVPLFFLLSGCVFSTQKYQNFGQFFRRKVQTILLPYFIWGVISAVIFYFLGQFAGTRLDVEVQTGLGYSLLALLYGNTTVFKLGFNLPLWFLPCLFAMQLWFYFIERYVLALVPKKRIYWIIGAFLLFGILNQYVLHWYRLPFNLENAWMMSFYFSVGLLLKQFKMYRQEASFNWKQALAGVICIGSGAFFALRNSHIAYSWSLYGNYVLFLISSVLGCAGWILIAKQIPQNKLLTWAGEGTLAILVMHKFPVVFFQTIVPGVRELLLNNNIWAAVPVSILAMALCLVAQYIIMKWFPVLLGGELFPAKDRRCK